MIEEIKKIAAFIKENSEYRDDQDFYLIPLGKYWMTLYEQDGVSTINLYRNYWLLTGVSFTDDEIITGEKFLKTYKRFVNE